MNPASRQSSRHRRNPVGDALSEETEEAQGVEPLTTTPREARELGVVPTHTGPMYPCLGQMDPHSAPPIAGADADVSATRPLDAQRAPYAPPVFPPAKAESSQPRNPGGTYLSYR